MKIKTLLALTSCALFVAACGKVEVSVTGKGNTIQGRGVTYILPWETSSQTDTPSAFQYKGETVTVSEVGGQLTVNGKRYGGVKAGDTVSLIEKGKVLVNDSERQPQ